MIVGKKADLVKKILFVLSYFIRCSDILETAEVGCLETFLERLDLAIDSPGESAKTPSFSSPTEDDGQSNSSATPVNTNQFCFDTSKFNSLPLDSILSKVNSAGALDSQAVKGDRNSSGSGVEPSCDKCRQNIENKVGKSVFYVNSEKCTCEESKGENSVSHLSVSSLSSDRRSEIQKKKESLKLGIKIPEGKSASLNSDKSSDSTCRLSMVNIVEDAKIERAELGRNCVTGLKDSAFKVERMHVPGYDIKIPSNVSKVFTLDEIRNVFRKEGSNSMFDEYFEDGNETMTVDNSSHQHHRSHSHSGRERVRFASGDLDSAPEEDQCRTPSMPDLTCGQDSDHRLRLGSLDHNYQKTRKSSLSRQISESSKHVPGRCR